LFYFTRDTFDTVPISVALVSEIGAASLAGVFQRGRAIDEKHGVVGGVFLAEFSEERMSENVGSCRLKLCVS
jgi:hypothetical protein